VGGAHCDAALIRWFVDHGGKLFEQINGNEPAGRDKRDRPNKSRHSTSWSEFLPTPRKPKPSGGFPQCGGGFLLLIFFAKEN